MALGHSYESKILSLFLIRGTDKGDEFELSNNLERKGGKLDDVIFKYKVSGSEEWRFIFLQAKHRENEKEKIQGTQLIPLEGRGEGHFGLFQYFRSFCRMIARGENVHACVIFTNIGFDLDEDTLKLTEVDDILNFSNLSLKSGT